MTKEEYLQNPCGLLSIPYWKQQSITLPETMSIVHHDHFAEALLLEYEDQEYFRIVHSMSTVEQPSRSPGFAVHSVDSVEFVHTLSAHINACYKDLQVTADQLIAYKTHPTFDHDLWIAITDTTNNLLVASGIAELDQEIGEGILEWIQVLPSYRGRGLGKWIVEELLYRLKLKATFVTVSGKEHSESNPKILYQKCGFQGDDKWHILTKK